ncbi:hypothetical protein Hanom_Chr11g00999111 [Helianthus anomalus]
MIFYNILQNFTLSRRMNNSWYKFKDTFPFNSCTKGFSHIKILALHTFIC